MQEVLVVLFIVFAIVYLGKKDYHRFKPKSTACETCSFGQTIQK